MTVWYVITVVVLDRLAARHECRKDLLFIAAELDYYEDHHSVSELQNDSWIHGLAVSAS